MAHTIPLPLLHQPTAQQEQRRLDEAREMLHTLSIDAVGGVGGGETNSVAEELSVASAVRSRQSATLAQMVSFFIVSMALTFRTDLEASVHAFGLALLFVVANLLSSYVQAMARRLLGYRAFARPWLAELAAFCIDNPVMFVNYVVMYILRANIVGPNDTVRLVDIVPVFVFFVLVQIELLAQEQCRAVHAALFSDMRTSLRASLPATPPRADPLLP